MLMPVGDNLVGKINLKPVRDLRNTQMLLLVWILIAVVLGIKCKNYPSFFPSRVLNRLASVQLGKHSDVAEVALKCQVSLMKMERD